jgi:long-chain acyl-CoA synthetase
MFFSGAGNTFASSLALHDDTGWYTYGRLAKLVEVLAETLGHDGKALVFCFCRNDVASVAAYLAALETGHAVTFLNGSLDTTFKTQLVDQYARDFIRASEPIPCGEAYWPAVPIGRNHLLRRLAPSPLAVHPDLAVLLSTSGSTGSPKCVKLTGDNILSKCPVDLRGPGDREH